MVVSLEGIPKDSLVYHFITSGKPGFCELRHERVKKLEAHHICYSPEITIKLCHNCHHIVHFWPTRLSLDEKIEMLKRRFGIKTASSLIQKNQLGIQALAKLIAPSRREFIHREQLKEEKARLQNHLPVERKIFKGHSR